MQKRAEGTQVICTSVTQTSMDGMFSGGMDGPTYIHIQIYSFKCCTNKCDSSCSDNNVINFA